MATFPLLLLALLSFRHDPPRCVSAYGKTACGYHCTAAYGDVQCSRTPAGACEASYGRITCWDPPRHGRSGGQASCLSAYGTQACGFHCVAQYGRVQCAETPAGACAAAYGQVMCWDPPRWGPDTPPAECKAEYGQIACGYGCVAAYGQVQCATTAPGC